MAHDVFISYASADQTMAQMVCATLEKQGIRCWMAPRDVLPGEDWGSAIVAAIKASRAMVLVFSGAANDSRHIPREVERAVGREIPLVPVRIENVEPSGSLEYSLSSVHWLDAITPPVEAHIVKLAARLRAIIDRPVPGQPVPLTPIPVPAPEAETEKDELPVAAYIPALPVTPGPKAGAPARSWRGLILVAVGTAGIVVLAMVLTNKPAAPVVPAPTVFPSPTATATSTPTPDADSARTPSPRPATPTSVPPPPPGSAADTLWVDPNLKWIGFPVHKENPRPDPERFDQLERSVRAYPRDFRPLAELGSIYYDARRFDVAIDYYTDALALTPSNSAIRIDVALAYLNNGYSADAVVHLLRVRDSDPRHAMAVLNLGVAYAATKNLKAADECWREIVEDYSGTWEAARARELRAKIRGR